MVEAPRGRTLSSAVCYQDPKEAVLWLEAAFGFDQAMMLLDAEGQLAPNFEDDILKAALVAKDGAVVHPALKGQS